MKVFFDTTIEGVKDYKSKSQKIRFLSERWISENIFCPHCGNSTLRSFENNRPVADFYCENCNEEYELKSKKNRIGNQVVDGAYRTMIERLQSHNNPNFFFLSYNPENFLVKNFMVIPKHFFVPNIIKKRKPLRSTTRRSGWIGCNILLNDIPNSGKNFYIKDGIVLKKKNVLETWNKTLFLRNTQKIELRGWLLDVMHCIDTLNKKEFTLQDIYKYKDFLSKKHPSNMHIEHKIRQQLQFLRDKGYLLFVDNRGRYRVN